MADDLDTYDPVRGPARERIDAQELADPDDAATVILDRRRRRPRYFDDRFLTARDLTRGQQYTLLRQADLAQMSGAGIVHGLEVRPNADGTILQIDAGLGIARTGESMALRDAVLVTVAKLRVVDPRSRTTRLVAEDPTTGPGTGMYVLVAHPVEYSRNAAATFPTATSKVVLADTELVEGTWFTLVPLPASGAKDVVLRGRARLAREVFVGGFNPTSSTDGLALAVVGIVNSRVQWIDRALASRSVGGDAVVGFGLQPRKGRLAYQAQFSRHLAEEIDRRRNAGLPDGLPAVEAFAALPPVGPLPRGAVEVTSTEIRQSFFPREVYVEMAIMPEDELPALLSEGLVRAPIDLEAGSEALEGVPVLIVIPVPRIGFDQQTPRMEGVYRGPTLVATGRQVVNARPIDALTVLRYKNEPAVGPDPLPLDLEAWRKAIESASQLWYVRRPQFATTSVVVPRGALPNVDSEPIEALAIEAAARIKSAGEVERFNHLFGGASEEATAAISELLLSELLDADESATDVFAPATEASVYLSGIMGELSYLARRPRPSAIAIDPAVVPKSPVFAELQVAGRLRLRSIELADVQRVAKRFAVPGVGQTLRGPTLRSPMLRSVLATAAVVPELAWWVGTPDGISQGGVSAIASLAENADIAALRSIASGITLVSAGLPVDVPIEEAMSFALLEKFGELAGLRAIWPISQTKFRTRLDELLVSRDVEPVFVTAMLMQVVTIGFGLETETDKQAAAILDALARVETSGEFRAPNENAGKILGLARHRPRDAVLSAAKQVSTETMRAAQERLAKLGFTGRRGSRSNPNAYRLLALASASFDHITDIAKADEGAVKDFVELSRKAVTNSSITSMRKALDQLGRRR